MYAGMDWEPSMVESDPAKLGHPSRRTTLGYWDAIPRECTMEDAYMAGYDLVELRPDM